MKIRFFFFLLLISNSSFSQFWFLGQDGKRPNPNIKWSPNTSISIGTGASNYVGDINLWKNYRKFILASASWSTSLNIERHIKKNLSLRASLNFSTITGSDNLHNINLKNILHPVNSNTPFLSNFIRNLNFKTHITELEFVGLYNLDLFHLAKDTRPPVYPYFGTGISVFNFTPYGQDFFNFANYGISQRGTVWQNLTNIPKGNPNTDQRYATSAFAIPIILGMDFFVYKNFYAGIELDIRKTFTDFLDDVPDDKNLFSDNNVFSNQSLVSSYPINNLTIQKGADWFYSLQLKMIYHFPNQFGGTNCPVYKK